MARDAHNATWRLLSHICDTLVANMATELAADAPAGLNVAAPSASAYYALSSIDAVRENYDRNHFVQVYVFPSSERDRIRRTSTGPTTKTQHSMIEVTIAVRVLEELGAADYSASWKTLTPREREFLRCETLLGAIQDSIDGKIRDTNGDDSIQVDFIDSRSGDTRFRRNSADTHDGTWGSVRFRFHQLITIPVQT